MMSSPALTSISMYLKHFNLKGHGQHGQDDRCLSGMPGKVPVRSLSKVTTRLTPCGVSHVGVSGPGGVLEWGPRALDSRAAVWTSRDESGRCEFPSIVPVKL